MPLPVSTPLHVGVRSAVRIFPRIPRAILGGGLRCAAEHYHEHQRLVDGLGRHPPRK